MSGDSKDVRRRPVLFLDSLNAQVLFADLHRQNVFVRFLVAGQSDGFSAVTAPDERLNLYTAISAIHVMPLEQCSRSISGVRERSYVLRPQSASACVREAVAGDIGVGILLSKCGSFFGAASPVWS